MNHQIWSLQGRGHTLLGESVRCMASLVDAGANTQAQCVFNARVLSEIGLLRWCLHLMMEAAEPHTEEHTNATAGTTTAAAGEHMNSLW